MKLTSHLPSADRERVEGRLHSNLIAWLTTVRPDGQPVTVPVWFVLRDDETILLYSRPEKEKLRNIAANPKVSFALDVTDIGRNIVRLEGTARRVNNQPPANEHPAYLAKYTERMGALFGTPEQFAALFSARSSSRRPNCMPELTARLDRAAYRQATIATAGLCRPLLKGQNSSRRLPARGGEVRSRPTPRVAQNVRFFGPCG
jgi:PPOX class probable F420-dependent enzyme